jgi:hypothetical protein
MGEVLLDGADRYAEPTGDLAVGKPVGDELGNQLLACCELPFIGWRPVNSWSIVHSTIAHLAFANIRTKLLPEFVNDFPLAVPGTGAAPEVEPK